MEADMGLAKPADIMQTYPSTDHKLEDYHWTFSHAVPRSDLPLFLGVPMAYHFTENCRVHAEGMLEGDRKEKRKRGSQHERRRLPKDLRSDEWTERRPESARSFQAKK